LALGAVTVLAGGSADAHFRLEAPASWMIQNQTDGTPEKMPPCGNELPQSPSNIVTPFRPGETIKIRLTEVVTHPGWYRVALALNSQNELPADPKPIPSATDPCSRVDYETTPTFPVLADHVLYHTSAFSGPQTISVTLPNVTCTNCWLQVIEFMSSHPNDPPAHCIYHHCANISIQGQPVDGGSSTKDAGSEASTADASVGSGGSSGAGGTTGVGGSSAGEGGSTTGAGGSTGEAGTTGGSATTTTGTTGGTAGASGATPPSDTENGCSCMMLGRPTSRFGALSALLALLWVSRRQFKRSS